MATIRALMPYLEQGFIAIDRVRHAYLEPKKQAGSLVFEWKAYEMEGQWSGPVIHTQEYICTWKSDKWGILYHTKSAGPLGGTSEYSTDKPNRIEQVISEGLAHKADGF